MKKCMVGILSVWAFCGFALRAADDEMRAPVDANGDGDFADAGDSVGNGLARAKTWAARNYASAYYAPGGPAKGLWLRGEWAWIRDRNAPLAVRGFPQTSAAAIQTSPAAFSVTGWFASAGYRLYESTEADCLPEWARPIEIAARYETFQNVTVGDLVYPSRRTDVFGTQVVTVGMNYYIKGNNAKIQLNYNWVDDPNSAVRGLREVRNDNLIANFQVNF